MKILLSDDSKFMRMILRGILEKVFKNSQYVEASNGTEAIQLYKEQSPDLLLLDLVMPEKGGIEVLQELKAIKHGKIIVISALGQEKIIQEATGLGADAFIVKPFDEKLVIDVLQKTIQQ